MWSNENNSDINIDDYKTFIPKESQRNFGMYVMTFNNHMYVGYYSYNGYAGQLRLSHFSNHPISYRYQSERNWTDWINL